MQDLGKVLAGVMQSDASCAILDIEGKQTKEAGRKGFALAQKWGSKAGRAAAIMACRRDRN